MASNTLLATVVLRLVFPIILTGCVVFRPSGLSFLYLALFLYLPLVPAPTTQTLRGGHTGRYLRVALVLCFLTVIAQIVFQIVLLSLPPYGEFLKDCEILEYILRHLGFVKLNGLSYGQLLGWLGPDVAALSVTIVTYLVMSNLVLGNRENCPQENLGGFDKNSETTSRILSSIGAYISLGFLCVTSSLEPSIPSGFYYLVFLGGATWWALSKDIKNRAFAWIFAFISVLICFHILALFFYQLHWSQKMLDPTSLISRLLGLVPLIITNCEGDPRDSSFNPKLDSASFIHPFALLFLFHLLVYETKTLLRPEDKYNVVERGPMLLIRNRPGSLGGGHGDSRNSRLIRRQTVRWHGKSSRRDWTRLSSAISRHINSCVSMSRPDSGLVLETTPLMTLSTQRGRYNSTGRSSIDGAGPAPHVSMSPEDGQGGHQEVQSRGQSITSKESSLPVPPADVHEVYDYDGYSLLLAGLFSIFDLFAKSSYIATNIIMMAWSITYHSWLTFILLLWACTLWMYPNQRKAMLYSSPGLVIYAELLLLAQYVYSLNLTDDELPKVLDGINFGEIGLVKTPTMAVYPILVKSLYTMMFWITLRQFVMERRDKKATIEDAAQESFRITVSTTVSGTEPVTELRQSEDEGTTKPGFMMKLGNFVKDVMTKFWIWVVAIMLFVIGLGGEKVVLYRIVYMALFLIFVLTFQLSYSAWRKMMYSFWLTVIVYSMFVLVLIYTYQFEDIPQYLSNYTGIPDQLQKDIGLEKYDTGSLFVRLLTPTFFVVITVVQVHYFHRDFLKLSEMSVPNVRKREASPALSNDEDEPPSLLDEFSLKNLGRNFTFYGTKTFLIANDIYLMASEILWRFLEIHIMKIVLFSALMLTVYDKCALHFVLFLGVVTGVAVSSSVQRLITHICSIFISILLLAKMIYQIDYINHSYWDSNCTDSNNVTSYVGNDAEWLGLHKIQDDSSLPDLLKGYIGMIIVLTLQAVVHIRQIYQRYMNSNTDPLLGILFPEVERADADKGLVQCAKYLFNYGFYKFGIEITLVMMVIVIGTRLDVFSVLYSFWLIPMFYMKRRKLVNIWLPFIIFVAVLLPLQYISCVGLPPFICPVYPWDNLSLEMNELKGWLFLPDIVNPPLASRLIPDFFLLLFACQQKLIFRVERTAHDFPGGNNKEIPEMILPNFSNPTPDFLTYSRSWLDVIKKSVLLSSYWVTLAIIFLTGTNRVNLFALGYLVGSFVFLWEGNEFYLRSRRSIVKRWNYLLAYNVFVIFTKSILQLVGCVFISKLQYNFCWFVQLFGIACLNKFQSESSLSLNQRLLGTPTCQVPHDEAGLFWDGITFAFLLFQRRVFNSFYFFHIRAETEAQAHLASRGAELIEELMQKQIRHQAEQETEVLEKIKMKMDRIKATHQKGRPTKEHQDHFDAIRSGDYYMFDEYDEDDDLEMIDSIPEEEDEDKERPAGVTISELMSSAMKTDVESAAEMARLARRSSVSEAKDGSDTDSKTATSSMKQRRKRPSRKSAFSFKSDRQKMRKRELPPIETMSPPAPLAVSDGEGGSSAADPSGGGGGGGGGDGPPTEGATEAAVEPLPQEPPPNRPTYMRRFIGYIRFSWAFLESLMISGTNWLNKFSRDYRHVSQRLAQEKLILKQETEAAHAISLSRRTNEQGSSDVLFTPNERREVSLDLFKQPSEESEHRSGGSGDVESKEDLLTVVEKPSPSRDKDDVFGESMDDVSLSEIEETQQSAIVLLFIALWYVVISHSDLVCYFVVFLNQIKSASLLSLPLPLMVLLWGSLSVPRPTKTFWVTIIAYTEALVVIKYLFQFDFFPWNDGKSTKQTPFWAPRIFGIEQKEKYAVYDVTLLMVVFFHRFMLKSLGLWKNKIDGDSEELIYFSEEKIPMNPGHKGLVMDDHEDKENDEEMHSGSEHSQSAKGGCGDAWNQLEFQETLAYGPQIIRLCIIKYLSSFQVFKDQILSLDFKVKVDVYSYMFICDFFNFLVVIFGFASFGSQQGDVSSYLEENKVPVPFLVMVILQFTLIVVDRALYLRKYILGKLIFQAVLVVLVHCAMFFVLPAVTERSFNEKLPPQMWYMVKCIYLLFSAYQIRSGYPTRILGNFLCKKYNYVNMFLFKGFMAVPFLFELRALMDWIWTETSMSLSDWLKLEDIFAHVFQLKCQRRVEKEYPQGRGSPKARWIKYAIGGSSLFFIIAIIWFPLVLFALGNTVGLPNLPTDISLELTIGSYQPIYTMSSQNNTLHKFTANSWSDFIYHFRSDKGSVNFLANYEQEDVLVAKLNGNSRAVWGISPPAKDNLIKELNSTNQVNMKLSWTITRDPSNPTVITVARGDTGNIPLIPGAENRKTLIDMISGNLKNSSRTVEVQGIFPKFLKVSNSGKATVANQIGPGIAKLGWNVNYIGPVPTVLRNLSLTLRGTNSSTFQEEWWEVNETCKGVEQTFHLSDNCSHLNVFTFNEKAFPSTLSWVSGGGIIGLYTTLVLVASKFVRSFFAGISFLIMFDDMPNVDRIFQLCLDIYLVRESGELALEEDLFAKLIFLYRSPETLIKWTRPKKVHPSAGGDEGEPDKSIQKS